MLLLPLTVGIFLCFFFEIDAADRENTTNLSRNEKRDKIAQTYSTIPSSSSYIFIEIFNKTPLTIKVRMMLTGSQTVCIWRKPNEQCNTEYTWEYHTKWHIVDTHTAVLLNAPSFIKFTQNPSVTGTFYFYTAASLQIRAFEKEKRATIRNKKITLNAQPSYNNMKYTISLKKGI